MLAVKPVVQQKPHQCGAVTYSSTPADEREDDQIAGGGHNSPGLKVLLQRMSLLLPYRSKIIENVVQKNAELLLYRPVVYAAIVCELTSVYGAVAPEGRYSILVSSP